VTAATVSAGCGVTPRARGSDLGVDVGLREFFGQRLAAEEDLCLRQVGVAGHEHDETTGGAGVDAFGGLVADVEHRLVVLARPEGLGVAAEHEQPARGDLQPVAAPQMHERLVDGEAFGVQQRERRLPLLGGVGRLVVARERDDSDDGEPGDEGRGGDAAAGEWGGVTHGALVTSC
jgi:hypothetical protein